MPLSGPQQKFADGIVSGLNQTEAYMAAYPGTTEANARKNAPRLTANDGIASEITRMRQRAEVLAGGAVLTLAMKRQFLYELLTTPIDQIGPDSYLCQEYTRTRKTVGRGNEAEEWEVERFKVPDKIRAITTDNDLAGEGSEAGANQAIGSMAEAMGRIRAKRWMK